jgi:hypothetical protein
VTPVELTATPTLKRQYPHVDDVKDWRAQQSLRLLWDRTFALEARLQALEATAGDLVEATNQQETQLADVALKADQALAEVQLANTAESVAAGDIGPFTGDDRTLENAGKVICGVGTEWASLCVATATLVARQTNADEMLDRIVWHLNQAGFAAARYPTPAGAPWHVLFDALSPDGESPVRQQSYRVISYYPLPPDAWDPADVMTVSTFSYGGQSPGVTTTPDVGITD